MTGGRQGLGYRKQEPYNLNMCPILCEVSGSPQNTIREWWCRPQPSGTSGKNTANQGSASNPHPKQSVRDSVLKSKILFNGEKNTQIFILQLKLHGSPICRLKLHNVTNYHANANQVMSFQYTPLEGLKKTDSTRFEWHCVTIVGYSPVFMGIHLSTRLSILLLSILSPDPTAFSPSK